MSNVLSDEKRQQILALGRLGWPLRRIEQATGVRRETASVYLKAAGIYVRPRGGWGRRAAAKPANEVTTDSDPAKPANEAITDFGAGLSTPRPENHDLVPCDSAKAAIEVTTGFGVELRGPRSENAGRNPSASACEPFQEAIELGLSRGRNTMAVSQAIASQCPSCQNTK